MLKPINRLGRLTALRALKRMEKNYVLLAQLNRLTLYRLLSLTYLLWM